MKFCVSTGVWELENLKAKVVQTGTSLRAGYRSQDALQRYCLLHIVVQGPGSFHGLLNFFVQRMVTELQGVNLTNFRILAYFPIYHVYVFARSDAAVMRGSRTVLFSHPSKQLCWRYMRSTECPSSLFCIYVQHSAMQFSPITKRCTWNITQFQLASIFCTQSENKNTIRYQPIWRSLSSACRSVDEECSDLFFCRRYPWNVISINCLLYIFAQTHSKFSFCTN